MNNQDKRCLCGETFRQYRTTDTKCYECKKKATRKKPSNFARPKTSIKKKSPSTKHVKIYNDAFGYKVGDYRACELTGREGTDIHHIEARQMGGDPEGNKDRIENLMALNRTDHIKYGDVNKYKAFLFRKHKEHLIRYGVKFDVKYIDSRIEYFEKYYNKCNA